MAAPYWLLAVPNGNHGDAFRDLQGAMSSDAQVFRFNVPDLRVGTLDKLMAVGDELGKVDTSAEQILRKIERTFAEVNLNDEVLTVDGESVTRFLQRFAWSGAKYPSQRPLDELCSMIKESLSKVEEELKEATAQYQDKKQLMNLLQRKRGGNLMVGDLREVIDAKNGFSAADFIETEYLTTQVVVVPKALEAQFLAQYETLASDSVSYGPANDRESVRGSPVVPRSAVKKFEDKEGYSLFLVKVLKLYVDQFSNAARERRFAVREFSFHAADPTEGGGGGADAAETAADADVEFNVSMRGLLRWCKAHYGEVFSAWIHVKALRTFVESVLRYGLPVDFMSALLLPKKKGMERKLREKLQRLYAGLHGAGMLSAPAGESGDKGGPGMAKGDMFAYVFFEINPEGKS